jgi:hypothetical protein
MDYIILATGKKIIQAQDVVALLDEFIAEMRAQESCSARNEYTLHVSL